MTEEELFTSTGSKIKDATIGKLFGKPCFKINKKAFVVFYEKAMVFKLTGEAHQDALSLDGTALFDPSKKGRPMKEWVQVPFDYKDQWESLAVESAKYIRTL